MKNTMTKSIVKRNQGGNLETEVDAEAVEECTDRLAPPTSLSLPPYTHQDHLPGGGTVQSVLGSLQ